MVLIGFRTSVLKELIEEKYSKSYANFQKPFKQSLKYQNKYGQRNYFTLYHAGIQPTLLVYHTSSYIPWARDLMEWNIYSRSNQIYKVTKQCETYECSDHHAEQLCKESVSIRSDKCRLCDILWLRW